MPAHIADIFSRLGRVSVIRNTELEEVVADWRDQSVNEFRSLRADVAGLVAESPELAAAVDRRFAEAQFPFRHDRVIPRITVVGEANGVEPRAGLPQPEAVDRGDQARADRARPGGGRPGAARARLLVVQDLRCDRRRPPPLPLQLVAPAPREVSFGRIAGRLPGGKWAVVVRAGDRTLVTRTVSGTSFDFSVPLPRRDSTIRVAAYASGRRARTARVEHVVGLPRSAAPRAVRATRDEALGATVRRLVRTFPGTAGVYAEDLVTGRGAAWNARARLPAASTLKVAIAVEALRTHTGKPEPGSYLDSLLRAMLVESDNDAANALEGTFGGGSAVDELLRGLGIGDTWMGGGYLHGTPVLPPIPVRVESQPSFPCCKYTTAWDLARLLTDVHLAAGGKGRARGAVRTGFTPSDARYLLYLLAHVPDRGKLGRFIGGGPYALLHKAGWISYARHDAGLVYWPGGVFVAVVMTYGSGVGVGSDVLAGRVASSTLTWIQHLRLATVRAWSRSSLRCPCSPRRSRRSSGSRSRYGAQRKTEMAAYAQRHYGIRTWRLTAPKVIVEHYTASNSFSSAYNTFAADVADSELHELPGVCAHFVIDRDGTIYQLVSLTTMCRHTVGLNYTAIGIEHVGTSDAEILGNPRQLGASLRLTAWLMGPTASSSAT